MRIHQIPSHLGLRFQWCVAEWLNIFCFLDIPKDSGRNGGYLTRNLRNVLWSGYFTSKWFKKHSSLSVFSRLVEMFQDLIVSHLLFGHSFHIFSPGLTMAGTTATEAGHQGFNFVMNTGCGKLCIVWDGSQISSTLVFLWYHRVNTNSTF